MKKYEIKDKQSDVVTHFYVASVALSHQPEWGKLQREEPAISCSEYEIANALSSREEDGVTYYTLPQSYEVIETDVADADDANAVDASDPMKPKR